LVMPHRRRFDSALCRKAASFRLPSYLHARRSRDFRSAVLVYRMELPPAGMFDFVDSKPFGAASIGAIAALLCFVNGVGGNLGLFTIPPLLMLTYWLIIR
jgi:hypothetical protein